MALGADLCLLCYEIDSMMSFSDEKQFEVIEDFSSTSRYLDDLFSVDNKYSDGLISQIYHSELQLNNAYSSETEAPFVNLHLSILDGFISCKIDKRDDFDFEIVFPYLDEDVPRRASYSVYISQINRFARVSSHVTDFNTRNKLLTAKLLNKGFRTIISAKPFLNFIDIVSISFQNSMLDRSLLQQGLSEP